MKRTQAKLPSGLPGIGIGRLPMAEVLRIHRASLAILERTGVQVGEHECIY
ncbi:MAG: hypothetical protein KAS38_15930 [Anaerolineales bacterium]|nr:hypothetical protein [Anaerolineales bacterium]